MGNTSVIYKSSLDRAIDYRRSLAREIRANDWRARVNLAKRDAYAWAKSVSGDMPGTQWRTLKALVSLMGVTKGNVTGWCEPRLESMAKSLRVDWRTVARHLSHFEKAGLIQRYDIPGMKRTRGRARRRVYICFSGSIAARKLAQAHGFIRAKIKDYKTAVARVITGIETPPEHDTAPYVLRKVFHTFSEGKPPRVQDRVKPGGLRERILEIFRYRRSGEGLAP